jgi:D-alanyl-D-alanine carboxypeptidase/D-alanyl-D-alanine-endopeptidase (penicillin-binding protein 4)
VRWLAALVLLVGLGRAATLAERIEAILREPAARRALWGILVTDLKSGETLYQVNANRLFVPASNTKLFTTALGLTRLGPDYRYLTRIASDALPDDGGRLVGDLVLVGGGDPNLSSRVIPYETKSEFRAERFEVIEELAAEVVAAGVQRVEGNIVGDDSHWIWERWADTWAVEDIANEDGPPVTALAFNDNLLTLRIRPGGATEWDPPLPYYELDNRIRPGTGALRVKKDPGERILHLWGEAAAGRSEFVAIDDPALYAALALRAVLERRGVTITGQATSRHRYPWAVGEARTYGFVLASRSSWPLAEDLRVINKVSQNLHAEMLLREVARVRRGLGSFEASRLEIKDFLNELGIGLGDYFFRDGSGLSRQNLVSPRAVVTLLGWMWKSPHRQVWLESLPVAALDGTLRLRFVRTPAADQLRAKTGTLTHVHALSGYAERGGRSIAFAILVNNSLGENGLTRRLIDRICLSITGA